MTSTLTPRAGSRGGTPIDPRIRARRIEVQRDRGRRRRRRLLALGVVLLLGIAAAAATQSSLLDLDHIRIRGGAHTTEAILTRGAGIRRGEPMLAIDPGVVRRRLEALPWVSTAHVQRQWPGTVAIRVFERVPVAVVGGPGGLRLVDAAGRVLAAAGPSANLAQLEGSTDLGPGSTLGPAWARGLAVAAALPPALRSQVATIGPPGAGDQLTLRDGIQVRLCGTGQLADKAVALDALLRSGDRPTIASINLCVPSAPALTPRPGRA